MSAYRADVSSPGEQLPPWRARGAGRSGHRCVRAGISPARSPHPTPSESSTLVAERQALSDRTPGTEGFAIAIPEAVAVGEADFENVLEEA